MKPFYSKDLNDVSGMLLDLLHQNKIDSVIDLGCGTGDLYYILFHHQLLPQHSVGVELKSESCQYFCQYLPSVEVICGDIREIIPQIKKTFDLVVCEQVVEHIDDDAGLLRMVHNLMHKNSKFYLSSIIRKKHAWWIHRYKGKTRLNPDHVREYNSDSEFMNLLNNNGFKILKVGTKRVPFILAHWTDAFLINLCLIKDETLRRWYDKYSFLRFLRRKLVLFIPGFYIIEALTENKA